MNHKTTNNRILLETRKVEWVTLLV